MTRFKFSEFKGHGHDLVNHQGKLQNKGVLGRKKNKEIDKANDVSLDR